MICSNCGKEIVDDSVFCKYCGKEIKGNNPSEYYKQSDEEKNSLHMEKTHKSQRGIFVGAIIVAALICVIVILGSGIILGKKKIPYVNSLEQSMDHNVDFSGKYIGVLANTDHGLTNYSVNITIYSDKENEVCGEIEIDDTFQKYKSDLYSGGLYANNENKTDMQVHFFVDDYVYYMDMNTYTMEKDSKTIQIRYIDWYFGMEKDLQWPETQLLGEEYFDYFDNAPILYAYVFPTNDKVIMKVEPTILANQSAQISNLQSFWGNSVTIFNGRCWAYSSIDDKEGWIDLSGSFYSTYIFHNSMQSKRFAGHYSESKWANGVYNENAIGLDIIIDDSLKEENFYGANFPIIGEVKIQDSSYKLMLIGNNMTYDGYFSCEVVSFSIDNDQYILCFNDDRGDSRYAVLYYLNPDNGLEQMAWLSKS